MLSVTSRFPRRVRPDSVRAAARPDLTSIPGTGRSALVAIVSTCLILLAAVGPAGAISSRTLVAAKGGAANDSYGQSVSTVGDVNGDGYADTIVGATGAGGTGTAYILFGGPSADTTPDVILTGEAANNLFGISVAGLGDVSGDGYPDVIVGAQGYSGSTGRAYIFYGGPGLVSKNASAADVIVTGEGSLFQLGWSVSSVGDLNKDGRADVILGAPATNSNAGRAYIFYGGGSFIGSRPATAANVILNGESNTTLGTGVAGAGDVNGDGRPDVILTSEGTGNQFGGSVASAGDGNGDGRSDVIVGALGYGSNTGRAYVFLGGPFLNSRSAAAADIILTGEVASSNFATSIASAGDVNGDGLSDLIVGAPQYSSQTGRAYLFLGGSSFVSKSASAADQILTGGAVGDHLGMSVGSAGDAVKDGFMDVLVSSPGVNNSIGRTYLYNLNRFHVVSPRGGDTWNVGSAKTVSWLGAEPADVWLSVDGGGSYQLLDHAVGGSTQNAITERVPHLPTKFARIKLTPADNEIGGSARSDSLFTIQTSINLLGFTAQEVPQGGTLLAWNTNPKVGPDGIAGYRMYRVDASAGSVGLRIGPDPITETHYTDSEGTPAMRYRLSAVNGLGEELELGEVSMGPVRTLSAWPLPYRGGDLHVSFSIFGPLGSAKGAAEVGLYDLSGRLVKRLVRGVFDGRQQTVTWDGRDEHGSRVAAGVYFLRAQSGAQTSHIKLTVTR